ncbi:MAG: DNA primase family protein [Waterburya sp.]
MPHKGDITDWVEGHQKLSTKELNSQLELAIAKRTRRVIALAAERDEQEKIELKELEQLANLPNWSQSDIACWLAEKYRGRLAWNTDEKEWYRYSSVTEGIWSIEPVEFIGQLVNREIEALAQLIIETSNKCKKPTYTISMINGVIALLKMNLAVRKWDESTRVLPLLNGVLDLKTKKLLPHSPQNRLTWCLPYNYNILATCEPIIEWLLAMCNGDRQLVELMRAYLLGVVTGRTDWQKFLELVGAGGTGKSTFTRLAIALVGYENVHTTTLNKLEKEKFETASIAGKRLVIINDSERYAGDVTKLKNLTGQDTLPYEVKYQQSNGGFTPKAMVIVSTNEVIQSTDYTSGLGRRRISIPMSHKIKGDRQKNLIEHRGSEITGEFVPYIPGLLNWVLAMDEAEASAIVTNYETAVPSLAVMKAQTLVETNPIADWLDNKVLYDPAARTNVGVAKRDKDSNSSNWYLCTDKWLYANYTEYCHDTGTKAIGLRRFVNLLSDLAFNQLNLDVNKGRDRYGSYFEGLKIRNEIDEDVPLITGERPGPSSKSNQPLVESNSPSVEVENLSSINVITRLWTSVMDKVTTAINRIINDGLGDESESSVETETKEEESISSNQELDLEEERKSISQEIEVGDRVTISDCPGHWNWASPFRVEAIEGDWVALEMVDDLIEMSRLQKYI